MKIWMMIFFLCSVAFAQQKKGKVIYRYKKFQEFDLEQIGVSGETGSPGDLTLDRRAGKRFKNDLPLRRNFNPEIRRAVEITR